MCACQKMAEVNGLQFGRFYKAHDPKLDEGRQKVMRTGREGRQLFTLCDKDTKRMHQNEREHVLANLGSPLLIT